MTSGIITSIILLTLNFQSLINNQLLSVSTLFGFGGNQNHASPPGALENQHLDPNDKSPGSLVLPESYQDWSAPLPRRIEPWDPSDDEVNAHMFHYRNNSKYFLWKNPPCRWYKANLDSLPNIGRNDGCLKIKNRLNKDLKKEKKRGGPPSVNCSGAYDAQCFEFRGHGGRCYIRVNYGVGYYDQKFVLINNCD